MTDKHPSWVREQDGWYVVLVMDQMGIPFVKRLANTSITPNQLTMIATLIRIIAIWLVWQSLPWWSFFLWQVAFLFDCMDGQLARLTKTTSKMGQILDQWGDITMTLALILIMITKNLWAESQAVSFLLLFWFILWVVNWLLGEQDDTQSFAEQLKETTTDEGLLGRYRSWAAKNRLKLLPITGLEEYTLLIPGAYALGVMQYVIPLLVFYRLLALGLRLRSIWK